MAKLGNTAAIAATVLAITLVQPALAADMPVKAAPLVPAAYDWSGIYIGGDAGWQGSNIGLSNPGTPGFAPATVTFDPHHDSFALGAFAGVQRQFGQFVLGVEGGYMSAFGNASLGTTPSLSIFFPGGTGTGQAKLKDIWNIGGRVGWAMGRWMPYITGGYANGAFQFNAQSGASTEQANAHNGGGYIGGGIDWAVWSNWILGVEYRHYAFSSTTVTGVATTFTENVQFAPRTDTVLVRASYKFDWKPVW